MEIPKPKIQKIAQKKTIKVMTIKVKTIKVKTIKVKTIKVKTIDVEMIEIGTGVEIGVGIEIEIEIEIGVVEGMTGTGTIKTGMAKMMIIKEGRDQDREIGGDQEDPDLDPEDIDRHAAAGLDRETEDLDHDL